MRIPSPELANGHLVFSDLRTFELWPDPEMRRERAYVIDLDSIVLMSEMPSRVNVRRVFVRQLSESD